MTQRDQITGFFGGLDPGNAGHGKHGVDASKGFANQAEVLIHARMAASAVGANAQAACFADVATYLTSFR